MNARFKHWLFDKEQSSLRDFFDHLKNGLAVAVAILGVGNFSSAPNAAPLITAMSVLGCILLTVLWMAQFWVLIAQAPALVLRGHIVSRVIFGVLFAVFYLAIFITICVTFTAAMQPKIGSAQMTPTTSSSALSTARIRSSSKRPNGSPTLARGKVINLSTIT